MAERRLGARAGAARIVHQVAYRHRSLDAVLPGDPVAEPDSGGAKDRRLLRELAYGSIRHFFSLRALVAGALDKPAASLDSLVLCLLLVGAYQLRRTRIPAYAAVNETVAAARRLGKPWAGPLVNSVLRRLDAVAPTDDVEAQYDHPRWLIDSVRRDFPETWASVLTANNTRAPMCLRVNPARQTTGSYLETLRRVGIAARHGMTGQALLLDTPVPTSSLPGFARGAVSIQDQGAQLAAGLLEPEPGHRVMDACAAPGGKALHLLEAVAPLDLVALDVDPSRANAMQEEFRRLGRDPRAVRVGDATNLDWWDGRPFDRVLLDAPCSGTGTLRRHPDIKLLKEASDIDAFHQIQSTLVATVWRTLAPGGILLYCTCSILNHENDTVLDAFLAAHPDDAKPMAITAPWGHATRYGRQLLPSPGGPDGFYYAKIARTAAATS